jgi:hypothetical protein
MRSPYLIQRCELRGKLSYDYMGSTEFEIGDQAKALKEIFAKGMCLETLTVNVGAKEAKVYMVAAEGFPFADYGPYLQELANHERRLKELSGFDEAVRVQLGLLDHRIFPDTKAWFDFPNGVLWTLTQNDRAELVSYLENIKQKWAVKAASVA